MIYKLVFKLLTPITMLPDSQTFFGAFANAYKNVYGDAELETFLVEEKNNKDILFSSMFYDNTLPFPMNLKLPYDNNLSAEKTTILKRFKKVTHISVQLYEEYINNKEKFTNDLLLRMINNDIIINNLNCLCMHNDSLNNVKKEEVMRTRNNLENKNLFYNYVTYYTNNLNFNVYVKCNDKNIQKIDYVLSKVLELRFSHGKNIGYNVFNYNGYEENKTLEHFNNDLLISKTLVDENVNFQQASYKVTISNDKFNNNSDILYRPKKVVFLEGSCMKDKLIGDIVVEKDNDKNNYQYLLGFQI